jgi:hypothetical protein
MTDGVFNKVASDFGDGLLGRQNLYSLLVDLEGEANMCCGSQIHERLCCTVSIR